jgi:uncharacterized membrane protein YhaH (DUF805 family)
MPDEGERGDLQKRLSEIYGRFREELPGNYKGLSTPTPSSDKHSAGNLHRYLGQVRGRAADSLHLGVDLQDLHARMGKRTQGSRRYLSQVRGRAADSLRLDVDTQAWRDNMQVKTRGLRHYLGEVKGRAGDSIPRDMGTQMKEQLVQLGTGSAAAARTGAHGLQVGARKLQQGAKDLQPYVKAAGGFCLDKVLRAGVFAAGLVVVARNELEPLAKQTWAKTKVYGAQAKVVAGAKYELLKNTIADIAQKAREPKQIRPAVNQEKIVPPVPQVTPAAVAAPTEVVTPAPAVPPVAVRPARVVMGVLVPVRHVTVQEQLRTLLREELPPLSLDGAKTFFAYKERLSRRHLFAQIWVTGALAAILMLALLLLGKAVFGKTAGNEHLPEMTLLLFIPCVLAGLKGLALIEQRLHDLNLSAWDILIFLVIFGVLVFFILCAIIGDMYKFMAFICWLTFLYVAVGLVVLLYTRGTMGANTYGAPSFVLRDLDPWRHWWSQVFSKAGWVQAGKILRQPAAWQLSQRWQQAAAWIKQEYFIRQGRLNRKAYFYRVSYIFTGMLGIKLLAELASALFLACMDTHTLGGWALWQQVDHILALLVKAGVVVLALCQVGPEVRRLHDQGNSGWWALLALVPGINLVYWLRQYCCRGDRGTNAYGHDSVRQNVDDEY